MDSLVKHTAFEGLFGRTLQGRANAIAACLGAMLAMLLLGGLIVALRQPSLPLAGWIAAHAEAFAVVGALTLSFAMLCFTSCIAMRLPAFFQIVILAVVTGALIVFYARDAHQLAPIDALTSDRWMLAVWLFILALPCGLAIHPTYPFRAFLLAALAAFVLTLPDYLGLYTVDTGSTFETAHGVVRPYRIVAEPSEGTLAYRASGLAVTWYLLSLAGGWAGLGVTWAGRAMLRQKRA